MAGIGSGHVGCAKKSLWSVASFTASTEHEPRRAIMKITLRCEQTEMTSGKTSFYNEE